MHYRIPKTLLLISVGIIASCSANAEHSETDVNLTVLDQSGHGLFYDFLLKQSHQFYQQREVEVNEALGSRDTALRRGQRLLGDYKKIIGELPSEKSPLNPQVTGVIEKDGYRIEKVVFESRPNHHVTAALYVPTTGAGPFPAVLVPCGHTANGKGSELYQSASALLAKNGFVALNYDPISQGERTQAPDAPRYGTTTHCLLNTGSLLVGRSIVGYEAWDGVRAVDFLLSRSEVDSSLPVGMTGNSGGGTQTTFLMALDDRIGPAAPSCYIMRKQRKYETLGPADGCQHLPGEVALGIDHIDYLWMRAPKPTLILAAERDFFEFTSTQDAAEEAQRLYSVLGYKEQTGLVSYDGEHGFAQPLREAATRWMRQWFFNDNSPVSEPELALLNDEQIQVTPKGQALASYPNESTVQMMNLERARELSKQRKDFWLSHTVDNCLKEVKRLIGLPDNIAPCQVELRQTIQQDNYVIQKLILFRDNGIPIPTLVFVPSLKINKSKTAVVIIDSRGKSTEKKPGGLIEQHLEQGQIVVSPDLSGFGETRDSGSKAKYYNHDHRVANLAMHIGRPLLGIRVEDTLTAIQTLSAHLEVESFHLIAIKEAGPVGLHAAAIESRIKQLTLVDSIFSWVEDVVAEPIKHNQMGFIAPGALQVYDLPDLVEVVKDRPGFKEIDYQRPGV